MGKPKYYTVWEGVSPGVYDSWKECQLQVKNYSGAKYKGFASCEEATKAYEEGFSAYYANPTRSSKAIDSPKTDYPEWIYDSIAVDAACSGNPGPMEYRGVYVRTGKELFRIGPLPDGTNNVGEFLALVHVLALLKKNNSNLPICSDSRNAITWVQHKQCKTKLAHTNRNEPIFDLISRAEKWLQENDYTNPIIKWETRKWGEIPADFGRK
ncbi:MAG: ribonuclease H family protein [Porphyromonadaceae bacterium]|nr:ribonuclease H family protein [Porphyromonadaceae bacterium]